MKNLVTCVFDGICHLGECPIWNVELGQLFWTDIYNKQIWVCDPATSKSRIFWQGEHQVGGFAFAKNGGMVFCTDSGVYLLPREEIGNVEGKLKKLFDVPMVPGERFNDITVDPKGRLFAGTLRSDCQDGTLYRIEKHNDPVTIVKNIGCSNGMTFSIDKKKFFHTDSTTRKITSYKYCEITGQIKEPVVFFQCNESKGLPDGITIDTEDHIWAAFWGDSVIRRINPKGEFVKEVILPAIQPSSVIFGGDELSDLYITTACQGAHNLEKGLDEKGDFLGGHVYKLDTEFKGRPEWLADFD